MYLPDLGIPYQGGTFYLVTPTVKPFYCTTTYENIKRILFRPKENEKECIHWG